MRSISCEATQSAILVWQYSSSVRAFEKNSAVLVLSRMTIDSNSL